jgi:hypothetical protein
LIKTFAMYSASFGSAEFIFIKVFTVPSPCK